MTNANINVTTATRTAAGKQYLFVTVTNEGDVNADVSYHTTYGSKEVTLDPLESNTSAFATRSESVPAGQVVVQVDFIVPISGA